MRAADIMTRGPVTIEKSKTVRELIETIMALGTRHVPVVDGGKLVGIVSDRDIREYTVSISWNEFRVSEDGPNAAMLDEPVSAVMSGGAVSVTPDAPATTLVDLICDNRIGALPVVNAEKVVVGIVSYVDLLRALRPAEEDPSG